MRLNSKKLRRDLKKRVEKTARSRFIRTRVRPFLTRLAHSYVLIGTVVTLLLLGAVNWSTDQRATQWNGQVALGPAPLKEVDLDDPWSFFHAEWSSPTFDLFYASASDASRFVEDPADRVEAEFKVPEALRKRVTFWMEIYSHYSSRTRVVHDREDPSIVYGHIDFRPVYRMLGVTAAADTKVANLERKILKLLNAKLSEAAGISKTSLLAADERQQIQSFLNRIGAATQAAASEAIAGIRTQTGQSDMFLQALYRSRTLLPHIESVFRQQGLPAGLARIPFVESSFNPNAKSSVGAVGIWQFMPETARELIHEDEESLWSDPLRQTKSAARMLKLYKNVLPDWSTTITSYNSGVGRVRRIVEKRRLKNAHAFAELPSSEGLGFAGKNFFSEFLAANLVEAYKTELFSRWLGAQDFERIFAGSVPFPKDICSAL